MDTCSPGNSGIMYQNYMDYTDEACMVVFTRQLPLNITPIDLPLTESFGGNTFTS